MGRFSLNGKALMLNNKFVEYKNGVLSFNVEGTHFPYSNYEPPSSNVAAYIATSFKIESSESNTATIDYGDGNTITYTFINNIFEMRPAIPSGSATALPIHTYTDGNSGRRVVRISFSKADKVAKLTTYYVNMYGSFPNEISTLSSLNSIFITQSKLTSFPVSVSGLLKLKTLVLTNIGTAISSRFPDEFLNLSLNSIEVNGSVNFRDIYSSNLVALFNGLNASSLTFLNIESCNIDVVPDEIANLVMLKTLIIGGSNIFTTMPSQINTIPSLTRLSIGTYTLSNTTLINWDSISNLILLNTIEVFSTTTLTTALPNDMSNCTLLKIYNVSGSYRTVARVDAFVINMYNFINANASKTSGNTKFRQMTITTFRISGGTVTSATPSGTYQQPSGFALGSNNGSPASPKEMIWVLVNQYQHTFTY